MNHTIVKQYLKKVTDNMVCERGNKAFIIRDLQQSVVSFAEEKPDLTMQDLYAEFGTPEEFALHFSDRKDSLELIRKAKKRSLFWKCLGIAGIILGIIIIICAILIIKDLSRTVFIRYEYGQLYVT